MISKNYVDGRYVVDQYEFQYGGDGDVYFCNFVTDPAQGFHVPAKSLFIENHGGGAGSNILYYRTIHGRFGTSRDSHIAADGFHNYQLGECLVYGVLVYASNANLEFSLVATPGEWTDYEIDKFMINPELQPTLKFLDKQMLTSAINPKELNI